MTDKITFIEVEPEDSCWRCGRNKIHETDRFFRVFVGDNDIGIVVCELCKGGFSASYFEGMEKSYVTHLAFYVRRSLFEMKDRLPQKIFGELTSAIESYEEGDFSLSFRNIGLVAEWLTNRLFTREFEDSPQKSELTWDGKLGRLLSESRKHENMPEEAIVHQLFSIKWFRNKADHPSPYEITGEDVRLGLVSVTYLLQHICNTRSEEERKTK
jgi:hypothetical protein